MRTMLVLLEIEVDDLTEEDRAECARDMEEPVDTIPTLAKTTVGEAASVLDGIGTEISRDLFAGSDVYVRYVRSEVLHAAWKGEDPKEEETG